MQKILNFCYGLPVTKVSATFSVVQLPELVPFCAGIMMLLGQLYNKYIPIELYIVIA